MKPFLYYLLAVSAVSAIVTIYDKLAAKRNARRVPERVLLLLAAIGGSVSMYATMLIIRHKTKHLKFMIGIPLIFIIQICMFVFASQKFGFVL